MPVNSILGVFAKSPIKPLQEHIDTVHACASLLVPFFHATTKGDWDEALKLRKRISMSEREADVQKRDIRLNLPGGLFMPVERTDLLELLTQQDKIANKAKRYFWSNYWPKYGYPSRNTRTIFCLFNPLPRCSVYGERSN